MKFDPNGKLVDVVEFEDYSNKNKGEHYYIGFDAVFYKVYWHDYVCSNDDGINRQVFICTKEETEEKTLQRAQNFLTGLVNTNDKIGILVKFDKN